MLDPTVLQELTGRWGPPDMDLFASRLSTEFVLAIGTNVLFSPFLPPPYE